MPDVDLSAQFSIGPKLHNNSDIQWDKEPWNYSLWQAITWAERYKPLFSTRFTLHTDQWLHWDFIHDYWDAKKWYELDLDPVAFKNSWVFDLGILSREINLKLKPYDKDRPVRWTLDPKEFYYEVYLPYKNDRYMVLPTWQHRLPKFLKTIEALISGYVDLENLSYLISTRRYNVAYATGAELDVIGEWVGVSREVYPPLGGIVFTWDDTIDDGWEDGAWDVDTNSGGLLTILPDEPYRFLILAKIVANSWDGTVEGAYRAWQIAFQGQSDIMVLDGQDMTMTMLISSPASEYDSIIRVMLQQEKLPLRPAGVKLNSALIPEGRKAFVWDTNETNMTGGWNSGYWTRV